MKYLIHTLFMLAAFNISITAQIYGGHSLLLDGNYDYVEIGDNPELTPGTSAITIEAWITDNDPSLTKEIISKYNSSAGIDQLSWTVGVRENGSVLFGVYENFNVWRTVKSDTGIIEPNIWYHVAATFDIANQESHIYVNGEEVSTSLAEGSADSISHISDSNTPVRIGTIIPVTGILSHFWLGNIDEVRIWNIARTKAQIQTTMNDTLTYYYYSSQDSGLVGYWRCDVLEDLGINADGPDDIRDFAVFQNHGDINGDVTLEMVVGIESGNRKIPLSFYLEQNFPNPFNPLTKIKYSIPQSSNVIIKLFDVLGKEIDILVDEEKSAGIYEVTWNAVNLPSGVYFYQIRAAPDGWQVGDFVQTRKMILLK